MASATMVGLGQILSIVRMAQVCGAARADALAHALNGHARSRSCVVAAEQLSLTCGGLPQQLPAQIATIASVEALNGV